MELSVEEKELLSDFVKLFLIRVHALSYQTYIISPEYQKEIYADDAVAYGNTTDIEILYENETLDYIEKPENNFQSVLSYAKRWDLAGRPLPDNDNNGFFKYQ